MNIKHEQNQKEVPLLINLMMICWQAMLYTVHVVDENVDCDPRNLTKMQYVGNFQRTQILCYHAIKFATSLGNTTFLIDKHPAVI